MRNPRKIAFGRKIAKIGRRIGSGVATQIKLIQEQQDREARQAKLIKPRKIKKLSKSKSSKGILGGFNPIADLDF